MVVLARAPEGPSSATWRPCARATGWPPWRANLEDRSGRGNETEPSSRARPRGAEIETYNDHRIAMSFAVLGLVAPGMRIRNPGCVGKSFPGFWEELDRLQGKT